ncbi:hemolymph lipopolysaccharide-binding protein [Anabrus simplex]|uniref:hemolymph lipopolysaccharide-binding protein n=1 Tax=Anabrus simplex TaxID=316456 RepID=UPI0035A2B38F
MMLYKATSGVGINRYMTFDGVGTYKLHTSGANWTEAVRTCLHENAYLAIVNSKAESYVLQALMKWFMSSGDFAYLGFHDREEEGKYRTVFGLPLSYTGFETWTDGYPVGTNTFNCGCIHRSGGLCDHICNASIPFICEKFD